MWCTTFSSPLPYGEIEGDGEEVRAVRGRARDGERKREGGGRNIEGGGERYGRRGRKRGKRSERGEGGIGIEGGGERKRGIGSEREGYFPSREGERDGDEREGEKGIWRERGRGK